MRFRYSKDPEIESSLRHSLRDAVAYAVMFGGETYFSAFAIFLQASALQIAVLAALPPLLGSLAQLVSVRLGRRLGRRRPIIIWGASLQAAVWLPLALLPLAFPDQAVPLLIGSVVLYYAAGNLISPQWSSLMGDLVLERRRGRFFAARTRYHTAATFIALLCAGYVLHFFDERNITAVGFIAVFLAAAVARMVSIRHRRRYRSTTTVAGNTCGSTTLVK